MIDYVDIVHGLTWGDEGKGKITAYLAEKGFYDFVCRWSGGSNAGHTIYVNNKKYKTHIVPAGIFYGIPSIIGPACVLNEQDFKNELKMLEDAGFNISLVKVSPRTHIVTPDHKDIDKKEYAAKLGTTSSGIGPAYSDKSLRRGIRAQDVLHPSLIWDENFNFNSKILCEGAQGVWLDIDWGDYPFVTSSNTLPYASCSLGFSPKKIRNIWGCAKAYDTRSGNDNRFPSLPLQDENLRFLQEKGEEIGVTTGRQRSVNWLNLDALIKAINLSGTTNLVISKCDILNDSKVKKIIYNNNLVELSSIEDFQLIVRNKIIESCTDVKEIIFSGDPKKL
jgi:adenylosuccinate synthase